MTGLRQIENRIDEYIRGVITHSRECMITSLKERSQDLESIVDEFMQYAHTKAEIVCQTCGSDKCPYIDIEDFSKDFEDLYTMWSKALRSSDSLVKAIERVANQLSDTIAELVAQVQDYKDSQGFMSKDLATQRVVKILYYSYVLDVVQLSYSSQSYLNSVYNERDSPQESVEPLSDTDQDDRPCADEIARTIRVMTRNIRRSKALEKEPLLPEDFKDLTHDFVIMKAFLNESILRDSLCTYDEEVSMNHVLVLNDTVQAYSHINTIFLEDIPNYLNDTHEVIKKHMSAYYKVNNLDNNSDHRRTVKELLRFHPEVS